MSKVRKEKSKASIAAANAISILSLANISLSGLNLNKIKICGANMYGSICNYTKFKCASL